MHSEPPSTPSLIDRIRLILFSAAILFYVAAIACIFLGANYLTEKNLEKEGRLLAHSFSESGNSLFLSPENVLQERVSKLVNRVADLGSVRIYGKDQHRVLAQYHKPEYREFLSVPDSGANGIMENPVRIDRTAGIAQAMQLVERVTRDDLNVAGQPRSGQVLGYIEIGMDFAPSRAGMYPAMLAIMAIFTAILVLCLWVYLEKMRRVLQPLTSLQEPLQRIAKGDFNTQLAEGAVDREIEVIHRALRTTIVALQKREEKRSLAAPLITRPSFPAVVQQPAEPQSSQFNQRSNEIFINNLSHELHTPMNGVIGMLDLLGDTELSRTQREFVSMARTSADNLLRRLNSMLDVAHLEKGQLGLEHIAFNLTKDVTAAAQTNIPAATRKGIELIVHPPTTQHHVLGNPARIRQIMTSLIHQTIVLTTHGRVIFDIRAEKQNNVCRIGISISSNGISLTDAQLSNLLNESKQNKLRDRHQFDGHELTLASCKKLAALLGGQIGFERPTVDTTTFWFSLHLPLAPTSTATLAASASKKLRVLFVSEYQPTFLIIGEALSQKGIRADGFHTAAEAMTALENAVATEDPYHIAFVDYQLQNVDGEVFGTAIKSDPAYRNILLMLLSAESDAENNRRLADAGFTGRLDTPLSPRVFIDALDTLCAAVKTGEAPSFVTADALGAAGTSQNEKNSTFDNYRVLVADDNFINQQVASHILERLGCSADIARNGQEAVNMHLLKPYDLILMDCQMPVLNGYQATKAIRAQETDVHTPIIALTAFTMQGERDQCIAAGMDDFLAKPIRVSSMREALGRWLKAYTTETQDARDEFVSMQKMFGADFVELTTLYLSDSPKRLVSLTEAVAEKNAARIAKVAHALSGSCASIGAVGLAAICKELELRSKADQLDNAEEMLAEIGTEYARVNSKLKSMVQMA